MKLPLLISLFYFIACGSSSEKTNSVVIGSKMPQTETISEEIITEPEVVMPILPIGAVSANYMADNIPFYAFVQNIDLRKGITTIAFQNNKAPSFSIKERYGATLKMLRFDEFDRDLLLVDTKLKDPQFHKYHLYILKNEQWLPVVKPFAIHESHKDAQKNPIFIDPNNPNNMFRYYSVFDIDETNEAGYGWRLHNESVAIKNR